MITNRSAGSRLAQMDVDMDKTAQNELPPYCKDCTAAFAAFQKTFAETEKLYHYTSFESAIKILASHRLRYSQLKGLNDINESYRPACLKFNGYFRRIKVLKTWKTLPSNSGKLALLWMKMNSLALLFLPCGRITPKRAMEFAWFSIRRNWSGD